MLRFAIDVHLIEASDEAVVALRRLHAGGRILLVKADVLDTELLDAKDDDKRARLL